MLEDSETVAFVVPVQHQDLRLVHRSLGELEMLFLQVAAKKNAHLTTCCQQDIMKHVPVSIVNMDVPVLKICYNPYIHNFFRFEIMTEKKTAVVWNVLSCESIFVVKFWKAHRRNRRKRCLSFWSSTMQFKPHSANPTNIKTNLFMPQEATYCPSLRQVR